MQTWWSNVVSVSQVLKLLAVAALCPNWPTNVRQNQIRLHDMGEQRRYLKCWKEEEVQHAKTKRWIIEGK